MAETEVTEITAEQYKLFNSLLMKVYGWVFCGLLITSAVPFIIEHHFKGLIAEANHKPEYILGAAVFELTVVWLLKVFVNRFPSFVYYITFFFYSVLNGIILTFAFNLFLYTGIFISFWIYALMFGLPFVLALIIKFDLSGLSGFLIVSLPGLLLATVACILTKSSSAGYIINFSGVLIFIWLAMRHRLKIMQWITGEESLTLDGSKPSILGALMLYLDFLVPFIIIEKYM